MRWLILSAWNLKATKFTKPGKPLVSWSVVNFDGRIQQHDLQNFVTQLVQTLIVSGRSACRKCESEDWPLHCMSADLQIAR